jgi:hypothetical protein
MLVVLVCAWPTDRIAAQSRQAHAHPVAFHALPPPPGRSWAQNWPAVAVDLQALGFIPREVDAAEAGLVEPLGRVLGQLVCDFDVCDMCEREWCVMWAWVGVLKCMLVAVRAGAGVWQSRACVLAYSR